MIACRDHLIHPRLRWVDDSLLTHDVSQMGSVGSSMSTCSYLRSAKADRLVRVWLREDVARSSAKERIAWERVSKEREGTSTDNRIPSSYSRCHGQGLCPPSHIHPLLTRESSLILDLAKSKWLFQGSVWLDYNAPKEKSRVLYSMELSSTDPLKGNVCWVRNLRRIPVV